VFGRSRFRFSYQKLSFVGFSVSLTNSAILSRKKPHPSQIIIHYHPTIRWYINFAVGVVSLNRL